MKAATAVELSWADVHAMRLARHHLTERAPKSRLAEVVREIGAVQAQLMSAAELQVAVRVDCTVEDVREALWKRKTLVKTWLMRGTLHLASAGDLPLYTAAMSKRWIGVNRSWLKFIRISEPELWNVMEAIGEALDGGLMTREELVDKVGQSRPERVQQALRSGWGGMLKPAARNGRLCFGPSRGQRVTFVNPREWLGSWSDIDPEKALVDAARRYLHAYGPSTRNDFAFWWGHWPGVAPAAWAGLKDELVPVSVEGRKAEMLATDLEKLPTRPRSTSVQLLPNFDPYLMGHAKRDHLFEAIHRAKVTRTAGWISPVVLVDGRVTGVWSYTLNKQRLQVEIKPFDSLPAKVLKEAHARAEAIATSLDARLEKVKVA
jgi:winged helix DNA-binding protein